MMMGHGPVQPGWDNPNRGRTRLTTPWMGVGVQEHQRPVRWLVGGCSNTRQYGVAGGGGDGDAGAATVRRWHRPP
jgi:hypothetical protein